MGRMEATAKTGLVGETSANLVSSPEDKTALANRFDSRAKGLRRQANIYLAIIIIVLFLGGVGFVFANDIASLNFRPQTAAAQYAVADAAWKKNNEELEGLNKRINEVQDNAPIARPFDDEISAVQADFVLVEEKELESCKDITYMRKFKPWQQNELNVLFSQERIGEYQFTTVDRVIFFSNGAAAVECKDRITKNLYAALITHQRRIQDITKDRDAAVEAFAKSNQSEVVPLQKRVQELRNQATLLKRVADETQIRAAEEQVLGKPMTGDSSAPTNEKQDEKIDWTRVVQTNLTRLGAVAIMFFLVGILVPQYRYNIRMAAFYDARADSVRLADKVESLGDIANVMTPNIDFGKAPATPWEHIVEVIKAARGDK
jgi:hypothetical protein